MDKIRELNEEMDILNKRVNEKYVEELELKLNESNSIFDNLKSSMEILNKEKDALTNEVMKINDELKLQNEKAKIDFDELLHQYEDQTLKLKDLSVENEKLNNEIKNSEGLKEQNQFFKTEIQIYANNLKSAESLSSQLNSEVSKLTEEKLNLENFIKELNEKNATLENDFDQSKLDNQKLSQDLETAELNNQEITEENQNLKTTFEEKILQLESENLKLLNELNETKSLLEKTRVESQKLSEDLEASALSNLQLNQENERLKLADEDKLQQLETEKIKISQLFEIINTFDESFKSQIPAFEKKYTNDSKEKKKFFKFRFFTRSRKEILEKKILLTHNMINDFEKKMNKENEELNNLTKKELTDKLVE